MEPPIVHIAGIVGGLFTNLVIKPSRKPPTHWYYSLKPPTETPYCVVFVFFIRRFFSTHINRSEYANLNYSH